MKANTVISNFLFCFVGFILLGMHSPLASPQSLVLTTMLFNFLMIDQRTGSYLTIYTSLNHEFKKHKTRSYICREKGKNIQKEMQSKSASSHTLYPIPTLAHRTHKNLEATFSNLRTKKLSANSRSRNLGRNAQFFFTLVSFLQVSQHP